MACRNRIGRRLARWAVAVGLAMGLAACDDFSRPNRPLPEFAATGLDGERWSRESFAGKPWVINLWVPG